MTKVSKTEKYLTEMKELPDYEEEKSQSEPVAKKAKENKDSKTVQKVAAVKQALPETTAKQVINNDRIVKTSKAAEITVAEENADEKDVTKTETKEQMLINGKKLSVKNYSAKDLILGAINLISLVFVVFLLTKLPAKAEEYKKLKNGVLQSQSGVPINAKEIDDSSNKTQQLNALFIDEAKVFEFASELDKLKTDSKVVEWVFATQQPIKDKTGNFGLPVIITLRAASLGEILPELSKIKRLPYLFRPISIDVAPSKDANAEGQNLIVFKYGILLYINEKSN